MRIAKRMLMLALMACGAQPVHAHDQWVTAFPLRAAPGQSLKVQVGTGHSFPESSVAIRADLLKEVVCIGADGSWHVLPMERKATDWQCTLEMPSGGIALLRATLVRPRREEPVFEMTAIVLPSDNGKDDAVPSLGEGFEIVPDRPLATLRPGDRLGFTVKLDGAPLDARIEVYPEGGRPVYMNATQAESAELVLPQAGRYLLISRVGGRGGALVFEIGKEESVQP